MREQFLEGKMDDLYKKGHFKDMARLKSIITNESQRKAWRAINKCTKQERANGVSKVDVCKDGDWVSVESQRQVEKEIMQELVKSFRLTEDTPLMK